MASKIAELILLLFNFILWIKMLLLFEATPLKAIYRSALLLEGWKYGAAMGALLLPLFFLILYLTTGIKRAYKARKLSRFQGHNHPAIPAVSYAVPLVPTVQGIIRDKKPLGNAPGPLGAHARGHRQVQQQEAYTPYAHLDAIDTEPNV